MHTRYTVHRLHRALYYKWQCSVSSTLYTAHTVQCSFGYCSARYHDTVQVAQCKGTIIYNGDMAQTPRLPRPLTCV